MGFTVEWEQREVRVPVYRNVTCDRCGKTPPMLRHFEEYAEQAMQYDNLLILRFQGAFGMFCDPQSYASDGGRLDPAYTRVYCHECAHEVCEFLGIDPSNWHTNVPADLGGTNHADHHQEPV